MHIIKDGQIVADDWIHLADDEAQPSGNHFTVSAARWRNERDTLKGKAGGLRLRGEDSIAAIADDLPGFQLIVVEFPAMADGRGFSLARLLRDRYGFQGEIRARGDFIRDQMFFLSRVGVNAFECAEGTELESLLPALSEFSVKYQTGTDEPLPLYRRR